MRIGIPTTWRATTAGRWMLGELAGTAFVTALALLLGLSWQVIAAVLATGIVLLAALELYQRSPGRLAAARNAEAVRIARRYLRSGEKLRAQLTKGHTTDIQRLTHKIDAWEQDTTAAFARLGDVHPFHGSQSIAGDQTPLSVFRTFPYADLGTYLEHNRLDPDPPDNPLLAFLNQKVGMFALMTDAKQPTGDK